MKTTVPFCLFLGLVRSQDILQLANPLWWIGRMGTADKIPQQPIIITTTTEPPPVLTTAEILFDLGPVLQTVYSVEDPVAKSNYIVSPLSSAILLSNMLVATTSMHYNFIVGLLKLPKHLGKKYHMNFLIDLHDMIHTMVNDVDNFKCSMKGAFFFKNEADLADHFLASTIRFFQTDIVGSDFTDIEKSYLNADHWLSRYTADHITRVPEGSITPLTECLMYQATVFETSWQFQLRKRPRREFNVKPFKKIKTTFYEGVIHNAFYVTNAKYTVLAIPDLNTKVWLHIILPEGDDWIKYEVRTFSEKLNHNDLNVIDHAQPVNGVKVKIPDIFPISLTFDLLKPVLNYKNTENLQYSLPPSTEFRLDEAGLNLSGAYQFLYFNINVTESKEANKQKPEKTFEVDRPFVFFLRHKETNAMLLWGSISDPSQVEKPTSGQKKPDK
ncbi:serpin B6-like [Rhynchophorus ferrugineus]|uniref:serpin B6-like n=1 Tax=Rhynchophorus ferrugineus TaxID=354439 RepID=UPI003FCE6AC8